MGPGLFLALALALACPAAAEVAVGLDAKGVDPMAAVNDRWGLDVRDELGRPVSGEKVLGELKQASAARAAANAFASKVQGAAAVLADLELFPRLPAGIAQLALALPAALATVSLPAPRPEVAAVLLMMLAFFAITASRVRPQPVRVALKAGRSRPEVLQI